MRKILFIKPANSSFMVKDEAFLASQYKVKSFLYRYGNAWRHLCSLLTLSVWLLRRLPAADVVFIWFADYHSWLPVLLSRLLGKKSLLVLGGYDVACVPEFNYGVFVRPFRGWCARRSLRNADYLLPVAKSMSAEIVKRAGRCSGTILPTPTGYSSRMWFPQGSKNEKMVLTVSAGQDLNRLKIKGLDLFAETAELCPDYDFVIVGLQGQARQVLENLGIDNLCLVGALGIEPLREYYQKANIYMQLSLREGLPNAVIEAMLCECVAIGSRIGGIPEAIGPAGFILEERTPEAAVATLHQAVTAAPKLRSQSRQWAQTNFSEERRHATLRRLIEGSH
ncbi:MAG TPA: glycosyltransferase family 4 protein [bacterium]|nr:glycosyltransferase family 4 protein [bacterium]